MSIKKLGVAHLFGNCIAIFTQLVLPPIFLTKFSSHEYGILIISQSIALIFLLAEFGVIQATHSFILNECTKNKSNFFVVKRVLKNQSHLSFAAILLLIIIYFLLNRYIPGNDYIIHRCVVINSVIVLCYTIASAHMLVKILIEKEYSGVIISNSLKLVDVFVLCVACYYIDSVELVLCVTAACRLLLSMAVYKKTNSILHKFELNIVVDNNINYKNKIYKVKKSGINYMVQSVAVQILPNILPGILSYYFSPSLVALFSTCRTLSRVPIQFATVVSSTFISKVTILYVEKKHHSYNNIVMLTLLSIAIFSIVYNFIINLFYVEINNYWLAEKMSVKYDIYIYYAAAGVFSALCLALSGYLGNIGHINKIAKASAVYPILIVAVIVLFNSVIDIKSIGLLFLICDVVFFAFLCNINKGVQHEQN